MGPARIIGVESMHANVNPTIFVHNLSIYDTVGSFMNSFFLKN